MLKKKRKPRTTGQDLCTCLAVGCDPMSINYKGFAHRKLEKRLKQGLCLGCGKSICTCKSNGGLKILC